ncbi:MAG: uncharacterized protein V7647_1801 [Acidobacteriota bacterium]|jgi:hypothetical protein
MKNDFYRWTRDLHLYFGLFVSPFILVFAASVFFLNHGKVTAPGWGAPETFRDLRIPEGIAQLQGRESVDSAREILPQVRLTGEIAFVRVLRKEQHLVIAVAKPRFEATVDVDLTSESGVVSTRTTGWWEALAYLHKSPGPHNVDIRGNWFWTRAWGLLADTTIYLTLFISITGVYLWYVIRAERRVGLWLLGAGAASFFGIIYAVVR